MIIQSKEKWVGSYDVVTLQVWILRVITRQSQFQAESHSVEL